MKGYQNKDYQNEKKSQEKKILTSSYYRIHHNFNIRGSTHVVNVNSKHVQAQINSARRIKARGKSIERKLPIRTFDDETRLTASELLKVIKNKEIKEFKNGISAQLKGRSTYVSGPFNPHKAKKIFASRAQKEAEKYFVKVVKEKFYSLKASDVLSIREEAIEKVFEKFKNHEEIKPIMVYIKNLWITYDGHLYSAKSMREKVDRHISYIIKNTNQEREEELLKKGLKPEEIYQIFRTVQGYNLYQIGILAKRGGASLEIYIRKELERRLKPLLNRFKDRMIRIGVATEKDFYLISRRHFSFLFNKKYVRSRKRILSKVFAYISCVRENPIEIWEEYCKMSELQGVGPPG